MAECSVCLEDYVQPCRTLCGHEFCHDCLRATLKARPPWNRGKCPLCRASVSVYSTVDVASGAPLEVANANAQPDALQCAPCRRLECLERVDQTRRRRSGNKRSLLL
jgi:hypothetical protein